jgi:hypothetical protein
MSANVQWDNHQHTILHIDYGKEWTNTACAEAIAKARDLYQEVSHQLPVDVMLSVDNDCVVAPEAAAHLRKCAHGRSKRTRHLILVCDNLYFENLLKLVTTVDPVAADVYMHARTLEEARQIIARKGCAGSLASAN